jgi:hypothetical protein
VALAPDPAYQFGVLPHPAPDQEERSPHLGGRQQIEDFWSPFGVGAVIEGEGYVCATRRQAIRRTGQVPQSPGG